MYRHRPLRSLCFMGIVAALGIAMTDSPAAGRFCPTDNICTSLGGTCAADAKATSCVCYLFGMVIPLCEF